MHTKIEKFAEQMQVELDNNTHKGNWEDFTNILDIIRELEYHKSKLINSMYEGENEQVKEHIADCANLLLMLGNSYKFYS